MQNFVTEKLILPFYLFSLGFSSLGASADLGMKTNELQIALSDPKLGTAITLIGWLTSHVEIYFFYMLLLLSLLSLSCVTYYHSYFASILLFYCSALYCTIVIICHYFDSIYFGIFIRQVRYK